MNVLEIIAQDVARLTVEKSTFQAAYLEEVQKREALEKQIEELKNQLATDKQDGIVEE